MVIKFKEIPNLKELEKQFYGLTLSEQDIFNKLKHVKNAIDTGEISILTGYDASTVQKCVKKLYYYDLIKRTKLGRKVAGYKYLYVVESKEKRIKLFKTYLKKLNSSILTQLELEK